MSSALKNMILLIVSFAMFMEAIDGTVINTAIPAISNSMNVDPIDLKLALISYLLSLAIFIPISGWIADKFGAKKVFIMAVCVFTLSSMWCGYARTLPELVVARIVQGLGGSLTLPVGRLIIMRVCERHEYIQKMSLVVIVSSVGLMLGPVIGGIITHQFSWPWIFWVNIPMGIFTVLMALFFLPEFEKRPTPKLDKLGFVLFGCALAALTFGLSALSESGMQNSNAIMTIVFAFLLLIFYGWHSRKKAHPIVKIDLLRYRTFRISVVGNILARTAFGGVPFLVPMMLQIGLGYSAQTSGLLLAPIALGVMFAKPLSLPTLRYLGYKKLLLINTFLVSFSLWTFSTISINTSIYVISSLTFMYGFLIALQYTAMNSLAYAKIAADEMSSATSIMSTIQQLAQSFGVAVAALFLRFFSASLTGEMTLTTKIFHESLIAMGLLTLFSVLIFMNLKQDDGHELIGRTMKAEKSVSQV
jgi:EmrB/QacA subfamily drug resistance transporter